MLNSEIFFYADIIGIVFFAISGALVAIKNRLDLLGLFISAFLTALGGGITRDIIVDRTPLAFTLIYPASIVFGTVLVVLVFRLQRFVELEKRVFFVVSDSIGLVAFSVAGALLALEHDLNLFGVIVLAFSTAVGGGLIRDILINEIPAVLISSFYGSIALAVALLLFGIHTFHTLDLLTISSVALFALALRLLAYYRKWHLPVLR